VWANVLNCTYGVNPPCDVDSTTFRDATDVIGSPFYAVNHNSFSQLVFVNPKFDNVVSIHPDFLLNCTYETLRLEMQHVARLPDGLFRNCRNLTTLELDLPGVTELSNNTLGSLPNLADITLKLNKADLPGGLISDATTPNFHKLYIKANSFPEDFLADLRYRTPDFGQFFGRFDSLNESFPDSMKTSLPFARVSINGLDYPVNFINSMRSSLQYLTFAFLNQNVVPMRPNLFVDFPLLKEITLGDSSISVGGRLEVYGDAFQNMPSLEKLTAANFDVFVHENAFRKCNCSNTLSTLSYKLLTCFPGTHQFPAAGYPAVTVCKCNVPGYWCPLLNRPEPCDKGTFGAVLGVTEKNKDEACLPCPAGQYNSFEGQYFCFLCPPGTFSNQSGQNNSEACRKCPLGHYCSGSGNNEPLLCPEGTYTDSNPESSQRSNLGACKRCSPNTFLNMSEGKYVYIDGDCVKCAEGLESPAGSISRSQCVKAACPPGFQCNGNTRLECQRGYRSTVGGEECVKCPPGKYADIEGSFRCQDCKAGTYNSEPGRATDCEPCPPNGKCFKGSTQPLFQDSEILQLLITSNDTINSGVALSTSNSTSLFPAWKADFRLNKQNRLPADSPADLGAWLYIVATTSTFVAVALFFLLLRLCENRGISGFYIDAFSLCHKPQYGQPIVRQKSGVGALTTVMYILSAVWVAVFMFESNLPVVSRTLIHGRWQTQDVKEPGAGQWKVTITALECDKQSSPKETFTSTARSWQSEYVNPGCSKTFSTSRLFGEGQDTAVLPLKVAYEWQVLQWNLSYPTDYQDPATAAPRYASISGVIGRPEPEPLQGTVTLLFDVHDAYFNDDSVSHRVSSTGYRAYLSNIRSDRDSSTNDDWQFRFSFERQNIALLTRQYRPQKPAQLLLLAGSVVVSLFGFFQAFFRSIVSRIVQTRCFPNFLKPSEVGRLSMSRASTPKHAAVELH